MNNEDSNPVEDSEGPQPPPGSDGPKMGLTACDLGMGLAFSIGLFIGFVAGCGA